APNSASVNNNKCGNVANCLMLTSDPSNTPQALQLSSETQTGIKIPSGQIAGGSFTIGSGQTKDLNIDFDACASVVVQGSRQYRRQGRRLTRYGSTHPGGAAGFDQRSGHDQYGERRDRG